jgi:hypothetical protein
MIGNALQALHVDPDGGGAIERPAFSSARLIGSVAAPPHLL